MNYVTAILDRCDLTITDCSMMIDRYGVYAATDILWDTNVRGYWDYDSFLRFMNSIS